MTEQYIDLSTRVDAVEETEPFRFMVHGEKFDLTMDLRPEQRKLMAVAEREQDVNALFQAIFGPTDLDRLDAMDLSVLQLMAIVTAYNEALTSATGEGLGEGSPGTSSLKSTGKPSKRTSRTTSR